MSRRNLIRMSEEEIRAFLNQERTLQIATINRDGTPHLVAMWYALIDDQLVFWTYEKSQKNVNLKRDPRLTCLVEAGEQYDQLRGVQIKGEGISTSDPEIVQQVGRAIWERYTGSLNEDTDRMVNEQATKRVAVFVKPQQIVSWDHRKLGGKY